MKTLARILLCCAALAAVDASAHDSNAPGKEKVAPLQRKSLPDLPGSVGIMATVHYAPGQSSIPHEHPGSVFAYVVEGAVVSQMEGGPATTYKAGESWYETPHAGHLVSKNASATKPATLVVFLLTKEGEEILKPR